MVTYGYSKDGQKIKLDEKDKKNQYSAQLYNYVASGIDIQGKDILEVGCGRGGGLSYITRYLSPSKVTGLDLNNRAIEFCKKNYVGEGITFLQGNAQLLKFEDNCFDVLINVESSHRYPQVDKFLNEVYRVLKPGGYFLFADFRPQDELKILKEQLRKLDFKLKIDKIITANVLEALVLSNTERKELINRIAPKILCGIGGKFAATVGTPTYNKFSTNEFEYFYLALMK
ncbi:MAG: class I SAM-dependent methyltransferase [Phaeodactylibacter sp.]|nr:class I SAM-dependent methyltransferase [Phaeodactylibacter sp.]